MKKLLLFLVLLLFALPLSAATYYVDYSSGADTNAGTSKAAPWKNSPGMQGCANTCSSTTINPGDSIILKGGVTWPNSTLTWSPPGGVSGNVVYIGVDKTWYTGGSWTRPIINAQGAASGANNITIIPNWYQTIDNLEITGFYWSNATTGCSTFDECTIIALTQGLQVTLKNLYIHGWTHAGSSSSSNNGVAYLITGDSHIPNQDVGSSLQDCVIDGSDVAGDYSAIAIYGGPPVISDNVFNQLASAMIMNAPTLVHDNLIENISTAYCNIPTGGTCTHENGFEDNGDVGLNFYNNVIAHTATGVVNLWFAPNVGYTASFWNNVEFDVGNNNVMDAANSVPNNSCPVTGSYCTNGGTLFFYNNTVQCGPNSGPTATCLGGNATYSAVTLQNNHLIGNGTYINSCSTNCTAANNTEQTLSTANGQGYNWTQTYAFSPTASGNSTIGTGANLTSSCTGGLVTLCTDTTYGVTYDTANHTAVPSGRTTNARPASGAWDAGAYLFNSATVPIAPAPTMFTLLPPTNLTAKVLF